MNFELCPFNSDPLHKLTLCSNNFHLIIVDVMIFVLLKLADDRSTIYNSNFCPLLFLKKLKLLIFSPNDSEWILPFDKLCCE